MIGFYHVQYEHRSTISHKEPAVSHTLDREENFFKNLSLSPISKVSKKQICADEPKIPMISKQLSPKSGENIPKLS